MDNDLDLLWMKVCQESGDYLRHPMKYYERSNLACTIEAEIELCLCDAEAGSERAQRYMAKFMELRMKA